MSSPQCPEDFNRAAASPADENPYPGIDIVRFEPSISKMLDRIMVEHAFGTKLTFHRNAPFEASLEPDVRESAGKCGRVRERPLRERARRSRGDRDEGLSLSVVLFSMSCVRRPWRRSRRSLAARRMGMRSPQTMACASLPTSPCAWPWRPNELSGRMAAYGHEGVARYRENAAPDGFQMSQGQPGGSREPKGDAWGQSSSGHEGGTEVVRVGHRQGVYRKLPSGA